MSNSENNDFILVIKEINKECPMKTNYLFLIILSIIEVFFELLFFRNAFNKTIIEKTIFFLISFQTFNYLFFSIYYSLKIKIFTKTRKEILALFNINKLKYYKRMANILYILGIFITIIYFIFILFYFFICFSDKILPNCDDWNKNNFEDIINLKYCQDYKCFNISNYNIKKNYANNYNYLCNFKLTNYLNIENNIKCDALHKDKINNIYISSKSLNYIFKTKNPIISF